MCNTIPNECIVCVAQSKCSRENKGKKPYTIDLLLSQTASLPPWLVPMVCKVKTEPNLILMSHSYLAPSCVFCWQKDKTMRLPSVTDLGGEIANDSLARQVRLEVFAYGYMPRFEHSNWQDAASLIIKYTFGIMCCKLYGRFECKVWCKPLLLVCVGVQSWGVCNDRKCSK